MNVTDECEACAENACLQIKTNRNKLHKHKHKTKPITKQNKTNTVEGHAVTSVCNGVNQL
jgi:hypothetical protein